MNNLELNRIPWYVCQWCERNDYTEPQEINEQWWAYPPFGVMRVPLDCLTMILETEPVPAPQDGKDPRKNEIERIDSEGNNDDRTTGEA